MPIVTRDIYGATPWARPPQRITIDDPRVFTPTVEPPEFKPTLDKRSNRHNVTDDTFRFLEQEEGLKLKAYEDVTGKWTIGYGNTLNPDKSKVRKGQTITEQEAQRRFRFDVDRHMDGVANFVTRPMTEGQRAAILDMTFQFGITAIGTSTMIKKFNAGDVKGAGREMKKWVFARDKKTGKLRPFQHIMDRRARGLKLFNKEG